MAKYIVNFIFEDEITTLKFNVEDARIAWKGFYRLMRQGINANLYRVVECETIGHSNSYTDDSGNERCSGYYGKLNRVYIDRAKNRI